MKKKQPCISGSIVQDMNRESKKEEACSHFSALQGQLGCLSDCCVRARSNFRDHLIISLHFTNGEPKTEYLVT